MQVSNPNNVKIYNLTAGKSLPHWLSRRRKNKLKKQHVELEKRVELIQDFSMPHISNTVSMSRDERYIMVTGIHPPRLRVFDTEEMSRKFEIGLDALPIQLLSLDDDYSKLVLLKNDRFVEFQHRQGKLYRTRVPKPASDMTFYRESCDLYVTTYYNEVYRLNLEQGRFLSPLTLSSPEATCCEINPYNHLFTCGTSNGTVECWDPRTRFRAGILDCNLSQFHFDSNKDLPTVTSLKYRDGLTLGVGTSTGHILLYDIRSPKPFLVKDHNYDLPIKNIHFQEKEDVVISMDRRIVKIWHRDTGKPYSHIEPVGTQLNDLHVVRNTGLMFIANDEPKLLTYYIPSLGPAPRWCSFLDNITEELEENMVPTVYDDYKFITRTELEEMSLSGLIGSDLLRAYMHGFFIDNRLYQKAKGVIEPFAHEEYRQRKIKEKIAEDRRSRLKTKEEGPAVNKFLANKLSHLTEPSTLLTDNRFTSLFENPDFEIDRTSRDFKYVRYGMMRLDEKEKRKREALQAEEATENGSEEPNSAQRKKKSNHITTEKVSNKKLKLMKDECVEAVEQAIVTTKKTTQKHSKASNGVPSSTSKPTVTQQEDTMNDSNGLSRKERKNIDIREKLKLMADGKNSEKSVAQANATLHKPTTKVGVEKQRSALHQAQETNNSNIKSTSISGPNNKNVNDRLTSATGGGDAQFASKKNPKPTSQFDSEKRKFGQSESISIRSSPKKLSIKDKLEQLIDTRPPSSSSTSKDQASTDHPTEWDFVEYESAKEVNAQKTKINKIALGDRLKKLSSDGDTVQHTSYGDKEMTFKIATEADEKLKKRKQVAASHRWERKKVRRSAHTILDPLPDNNWRGLGARK